MRRELSVLPDRCAVCRLDGDRPVPDWAAGAGFSSITRTGDELSIVCSSKVVPAGATAESGWRCLKVEGPLAFDMTGVLAALSTPLAEGGVPIFVVSTYDTDYLLVKAKDLDRACTAFRNEGHTVDATA